MTVAEIIILIIGAILFTVSFFIPDKDNGKGVALVDEESARRAVENAVSEEMKRIKETIDEATEESISDNKDKMERYMDRLTNEKMMAVNEYSDTVLEQIHKDHQEAVFLFDMIDSKYTQVKSTAAEINQIEKSVRKLSEEMPKEPAKAEPPKVEAPKAAAPKAEAPKPAAPLPKKVEVTTELKKPDYSVNFEPLDIEAAEVVTAPAVEEAPAEVPAAAPVAEAPAEIIPEAAAPEKTEEKKPAPKASKPKKEIEVIETSSVNGIELMFDSDSNSMNNNDRILALHKEGKSNMAIAKELGLGVGEVKLVIDLFKSY